MKLVKTTTETTQDELNEQEVTKLQAKLKAAHQGQVKSKGAYITAARTCLDTHEGLVAMVRYGRDLYESYGDDTKGADKSMRALNNAISRACEEKDDAPILTINRKATKWVEANDYIEKTHCGDKYAVLMVKPERVKQEKPQVDKDLQVAFNEYVKAVKSGEQVQLFREALSTAQDEAEAHYAASRAKVAA